MSENEIVSNEVLIWIEKKKLVEFDCETENGFGWYWTTSDGTTDDKGYMIKETAADAALKWLNIKMFVIKSGPHIWGIDILFGGTLEQCKFFMQQRASGSCDLMYPCGMLASYILGR